MTLRAWSLAVALAAAAALVATVLTGLVVLAVVAGVPNDDGSDGLYDGIVAGASGAATGLVAGTVAFVVALRRLAGSGRGLPAVVASAAVVGLAVGLIAVLDDGAGPEDVIIAWLAVPAVVVAQWTVLQLVSLRQGLVVLSGIAAAMVVAGLV